MQAAARFLRVPSRPVPRFVSLRSASFPAPAAPLRPVSVSIVSPIALALAVDSIPNIYSYDVNMSYALELLNLRRM